MLRRVTASLTTVATAAIAVRFYTPSASLKKLYSSEFDKEQYPASIVPSDSVLFAKFLYKAAEQNNSFEAVLNDFRTIAAAVPTLPVFWERTAKIESVKEFAKLSEPTMFTMLWMQSNGMLDMLADVAEIYETYVNAKLKRAVAKIYVAPGKSEDTATVERARAVAQQLLKDNKTLAGYTLMFKVIVDRSFVDGFAVDLNGSYVSEAVGRQAEVRGSDEANYINVPPLRVPPVAWADSVETEVMQKFYSSLAEYDEEELKNGV